MPGVFLIIGTIFMFAGMACNYWFNYERVAACLAVLGLIFAFVGMSIGIGNEPKKCACEETVQVETCEDCGGILE